MNERPDPVFIARQALIKLVLDSQNNINSLVRMQEQQMIYIKDLMSKVDNESRNTGSQENIEESGDKNDTNQPTDTQSIT
jgi:hypothetical protein